jgi:undecaprenyl diphosphate synthase
MNELKHVAIIMDGNRRWAAERGLPKFFGHTEGAKNLEQIVRAAMKAKLECLTLYALSTENFKNRSGEELEHLFSLFEKLIDYQTFFLENNLRFNTIGKVEELPERVQKSLADFREKTKEKSGLVVTIAVNYGGRDEIVRAVKKLSGAKEISERFFSECLDTTGLPDVDLVIRTGGDKRLSNFLLWQAAYAELYFTDIKWPAFSGEDFRSAVDWFNEQKRNKGK